MPTGRARPSLALRYLRRAKLTRTAKAAISGALALACLSIPAQAEFTQKGDVRVSFDGGISPQKLPRATFAPVGVRVVGNVEAVNGSRLPQLRTITVAINRAGRLFDKGLPTCKIKTIQPATEAVAKQRCADSIVGRGHVALVVRLPSQEDFAVTGDLLAFNGPRRDGAKLILAQVYSKNPPGAFILTFTVKKHKGAYGTVISTELPKYAEGWAYLTEFEMILDRTYSYKGQDRSYVSAACSAPAGFTQATFPFARATYGFDSGPDLTTTVVRTCKVR